MIRQQPHAAPSPALKRLASLAPLDAPAQAAVTAALADAQPVRARRDIMAEGTAIAAARLIAGGWAARVKILVDGRRQFLSFLLPGDLIGWCRHPAPRAGSTVTALTEVALSPLPTAPALDDAYAMSAALEEAYLLEHIARLGRLNALERIYSLLLELNERLERNGLAVDGRFDMPLTQEMLGDALGLTAVHVNRMLQEARRAGALDWTGGRIVLHDPAALSRQIGRVPTRVSQTLG
jgi:CRP-like cAMP-binding protein